MTPSDNGATYADDAGRYLLESRIATGGMGEVWRARDTALGRDVAVKLLKPEFAGDPVFRSRFEAEARHAARLQHPGIAAVFDVGEQMTHSGDVRPFLVMELVDGRPLSALIRPGVGMDPTVVRDLLGQAGEALAAAHAAGIVHRDVKPANLLVTADRKVKVTDFGIARALSSASVTGTGAVMGTPQYLSPEQARGDVASPASDVYGLGVVAYECLAGRRPFEKETAVATALAHLNEPVPPLPATVPADLAAVVMRALAKQPAERFPDAAAFAAAVRGTPGAMAPPTEAPTEVAAAVPAADATQVLTGVGAPVAAPGTAATPVARPQDEEERRANPWLIGLVAALLLAAVLAAWLVLRNGSDDVPPAAPTTPTPTATTPTATPTQTPTSSPTAETFDLDASDYVGRDVDEVLADLRAKGLQPRAKEIDNPGDERADSVTAVSPTKGLQEGDRVDVAYYGEPPATQSPTTQEPTTAPPSTTTAPSTSAPPTPPATTPQTAETTSTTTASASETPAARKDTSR